MSATVASSAFAAGERFERLCGALETGGYADRLFDAALEALGEKWSRGGSAVFGTRWIEHRSGRVRVHIEDGEFSVTEYDLFSFELGTVVFKQKRRGDRRFFGPRALRYASELAQEIGR